MENKVADMNRFSLLADEDNGTMEENEAEEEEGEITEEEKQTPIVLIKNRGEQS